MKKLAKLILLAALLTPLAALPAKADRGGDRRDGGGRPHYVNHDRGGHEGRWNHGWHNGRFGWWWAAGPAWSYYPAYPAVEYGYYPAPVYARPVYVARPVAPAPLFGLSFDFR